MGQKVHPLGFRRGFFGHPKKDSESLNLTQNQGDLQSLLKVPLVRKMPGPLRTSFEYGPRPGKGQNSYSQKLHEDFILESLVQEVFQKSGFLVASVSIWRTSKELEIFLEIFEPLTPLQKEGSLKKPARPSSFSDPKGRASLREASDLRLPGVLDLELETLTNYFEKVLTPNLSVHWYITTLNKFLPKVMGDRRSQRDKNSLTKKSLPSSKEGGLGHSSLRVEEDLVKSQDLASSLTNSLRSFNKEFFFKNGIAILTLTFLRPNASLLAKFMGAVMEDLPKGQPFIDFIGQGLATQSFSPNGPLSPSLRCPVHEIPLKGSLIKVKGRINGSDRSRTSSYRFGSMPLHTIDAYIDYGFATTHTSYGASSIKVWLKA